MRLLALLVLVATAADAQDAPGGRFTRVCRNRSDRGFLCDDLAFFEAFPANGAGTTTACSTTAPTGAKGEALTFARASNGTCTKTATGGYAATGIANGDLVVLTNDQPRVEYSSLGPLALLVEAAGNQICTRTAEICNAVWADVGTPACATDAAAGPFGTTTMDSITDNDGAAFEGRSQVIADTSLTQHTVSCYVKSVSGTAAASITLGGTGNAAGDCTGTATGLSTTTSSIVSCTGAAYGAGLTAVTVAIRVGTAASDQGVLLVEGCDVKTSAPYLTSHMPATVTGTTRAAELASFPLVPASVATGSMSARVQLLATASAGLLSATAAGAFKQSILTFTGERAYVGGVSLVGPLAALAAGQRTVAMWWDGSSTNLVLDGATTTGAAGTPAATDRLQIGNYDSTAATNEPGIYSRICYDPSPTRCR